MSQPLTAAGNVLARPLHVAGAAGGPDAGSPDGHLLVWGDPLHDGHRPAPVPGGELALGDVGDPARHPDGGLGASKRAPGGTGPHHRRCLEKDPGAPLSSRPRTRALDLEALRRDVESGSAPVARRRAPVPGWLRWTGAAVVAVGLLALVGRGGGLPLPWPSPVSRAGFDAAEWVIAVLPSQTALSESQDLAAINEGLALTLTSRLTQLSRTHGLQVDSRQDDARGGNRSFRRGPA